MPDGTGNLHIGVIEGTKNERERVRKRLVAVAMREESNHCRHAAEVLREVAEELNGEPMVHVDAAQVALWWGTFNAVVQGLATAQVTDGVESMGLSQATAYRAHGFTPDSYKGPKSTEGSLSAAPSLGRPL